MENNSSGSLSDAYFHFGFYFGFNADFSRKKSKLSDRGNCRLYLYSSYFIFQRIKIKKFKKNSIKIPGKIIGLKTHRFYNYNSADYNFTYYLIVNYVNPQTGKTEEYTTRESVNASPFYALKSLDVSVYYKDREHIWVNDFKRIKKLQENIAFQVTGYVDGKDPGVLKYVED